LQNGKGPGEESGCFFPEPRKRTARQRQERGRLCSVSSGKAAPHRELKREKGLIWSGRRRCPFFLIAAPEPKVLGRKRGVLSFGLEGGGEFIFLSNSEGGATLLSPWYLLER